MRLRSWLLLGIGYLAGTKAGREKFEELKGTVRGLASSDVAADAINTVRETLGLPPQTRSGGDSDQPPGWQHEDGGWVPEDTRETKADTRGQVDSPGVTDEDPSKRSDTTAET